MFNMKAKNYVWLVCLLFCLSTAGNAQVLKLEGGVALAGMTNKGIDIFDKLVGPFQMSAGIDYMDRGWYELSSSVGYLRKGGAGEIGVTNEVGQYLGEARFKHKLDYLTVNTTFRVKKVFQDKYTLYAGIGPRVDFALKGREGTSSKFADFIGYREVSNLRKVIVGLKCEAGINYMIDRYMVGANISYLPSFMKPLNNDFRDRTFSLGLVVGYVL